MYIRIYACMYACMHAWMDGIFVHGCMWSFTDFDARRFLSRDVRFLLGSLREPEGLLRSF